MGALRQHVIERGGISTTSPEIPAGISAPSRQHFASHLSARWARPCATLRSTEARRVPREVSEKYSFPRHQASLDLARHFPLNLGVPERLRKSSHHNSYLTVLVGVFRGRVGRMRMLRYTRINTSSQDAQLQLDALIAAGVQKRDVFADVTSGSKTAIKRPGMKKLLEPNTLT